MPDILDIPQTDADTKKAAPRKRKGNGSTEESAELNIEAPPPVAVDDTPAAQMVGKPCFFWWPDGAGKLRPYPAVIIRRSVAVDGGWAVSTFYDSMKQRSVMQAFFADEPRVECLTWAIPDDYRER